MKRVTLPTRNCNVSIVAIILSETLVLCKVDCIGDFGDGLRISARGGAKGGAVDQEDSAVDRRVALLLS